MVEPFLVLMSCRLINTKSIRYEIMVMVSIQ